MDGAIFGPLRFISDFGSSVATGPENLLLQALRYKGAIYQKDHDLYSINYEDLTGDETNGIIQYPGDCGYFLLHENPNNQDAAKAALSGCRNIRFPSFRNSSSMFDAKEKNKLLNGGTSPISKQDLLDYILKTPVQGATTVFLSKVGASAWHNMVRRTRLAFSDERNSCPDHVRITREDEPLFCNDGGFSQFFRALTSVVSENDPNDNRLAYITTQGSDGKNLKIPVTIEFYGHSMGAIVGDEAVVRYSTLPWSKIVYMAAANSIRDFKTTVRQFDSVLPDQRPTFHILTLHPLAEATEREMYGLVPQGSLLEWIDEMFNEPKTADDRTLGKWKNFEATLPNWSAEQLKNIYIRVFPAQTNLNHIEYHNNSPAPNRSSNTSNSTKLTKADYIESEQDLFGRECDKTTVSNIARCHPLTHGEFNHFTFWRGMFQLGSGNSTNQSSSQ